MSLTFTNNQWRKFFFFNAIKRNCYSEHLPWLVALSSQQTDSVLVLVRALLELYGRGAVFSPGGSTPKEEGVFVSI